MYNCFSLRCGSQLFCSVLRYPSSNYCDHTNTRKPLLRVDFCSGFSTFPELSTRVPYFHYIATESFSRLFRQQKEPFTPYTCLYINIFQKMRSLMVLFMTLQNWNSIRGIPTVMQTFINRCHLVSFKH